MEVILHHDKQQFAEKAIVRMLGKELNLSLILEEDELAPLFSGSAWAGTVIWDAAIQLCEYLFIDCPHIFKKSSRVVELGCGIGVPGMIAASLGASVVLTEQKDLVSLLQKNIVSNFNKDTSITAEELSWGEEAADNFKINRSFDIVISCDCIYKPLYGDSWKLLALTLQRICEPFTIALISVERRKEDGVDEFLDFLDTQTTLSWILARKLGKIEIYTVILKKKEEEKEY